MTKTLINLTSGEQVQGTLPVANGGTGNTSLAAAGIEQTANKNAVSGYPGLSAAGFVAPAQLGSGTASSTTMLTGNNTWISPALIPDTVTTSAATTLTLTTGSNVYIFTGASPTIWTLPPVTGNTGSHIIIENRGSAAITLQRAGTDQIWFLSALTSVTISAGASMHVICDGTYWNALSIDLANSTAGTLPAASGGTGLTSPGASGNVLTSNGAAWTSAAPSGGGGGGGSGFTNNTANVTLTSASTSIQQFSGSSAITATLNNSFSAGGQILLLNVSTAMVTVNANDGTLVVTLAPNTSAVVTANTASPGTLSAWDVQYGGIIKPASLSVTTTSAPSINTDALNVYMITALASAISGFTFTGSPVAGQRLLIGIKDNGTSWGITWGSSVKASGVAAPLTATVAGKQHWIGFIYDGSFWVCVAVDAAGY